MNDHRKVICIPELLYRVKSFGKFRLKYSSMEFTTLTSSWRPNLEIVKNKKSTEIGSKTTVILRLYIVSVTNSSTYF